MKNTILTIFLFSCCCLFAQKRSRADRFFDNADYINAAKYYEKDLEKKQSKKDIERIAISYYNTFEYRKAALYLQKLVKGRFDDPDKSFDNIYYFKLYQILSTYGDYELGLDYLEKYKESIGQTLDKEAAIETIEEFKLKDADYTTKRVKINTDASEFGATLVGDSIYFTSDRVSKKLFRKTYKWTHRSFLNIYAVKVNDKLDTIGEVVKLSKSINSRLHEGNFCFSKDGKTLYISKSNTIDGKKQFHEQAGNSIHIYKTTFVDSTWTALEKLPFNKDGFSYQHPVLNHEENRLYLSSNQEGGEGSFDIYYFDIISQDIDNKLVNLGPTINTEQREHFPYISKEGNLFFSSNGHLGLGMLDIFVSELVDNNYTKPINLGSPINSRYDDFNLNYYNETEGFFASNRNKQSDNTYSFEQIGEIFIREYNNIFEVRDVDTDSLVANVHVQLLDKNDQPIYINNLGDKATFNKNLIVGNYLFEGQKEGYYNNSIAIKTHELQDDKHILYLQKEPEPEPEPKVDPELEKEDPTRFALLTDTKGPPVVEKDGKLFFELPPIYFDFDKWTIRADSKLVLDELASKLERYPDIHLKISAHTDNRGSARYNQILSERRAEATRNYLALEGYINARRFQFVGYGESTPIVECPVLECTEEEHQLNRRSEFEIVEY